MTDKKPRFDFCYVISHGFALRMLMQTQLLFKMAELGLRVAIVSPDKSDPSFASLEGHPNIEIFECKEKLTIWDDNYGFKRRYFLEDVRANPVFWEKHIHSIFYSKSKHPWKRIRPLYYYLIFLLIKVFPGIRKRFKKNEKRNLESVGVEKLLQEINPAAVVSTYPINYLESKFLYAAEKNQIAKIIHLLSWDNITSKGIFPIQADKYVVWGDIMEEELLAYYDVSANDVYKCGVVHFDGHILEAKQSNTRNTLANLGLNVDLPYIFIAMSSPRFAPYEVEIVEWMAKQIQQNTFGDKMQLIVRPHPQNVQGAMSDQRWIGRLKALSSSRVGVSFPSLAESGIRWSMTNTDMYELTDLIQGASVSLNSGSTVSIDSLVLGKPVVITAFDGSRTVKYMKSARRLMDYTHLKKFIALGGAEVAEDYESLSKLINAYIENPDRRLEERQNALNKQCYLPDGHATERVIQAMQGIKLSSI